MGEPASPTSPAPSAAAGSLHAYLDAAADEPAFRAALADLRGASEDRGSARASAPATAAVAGLSEGAGAYFAAWLRESTGRPFLWVAATPERAERAAADLESFLPRARVHLFPGHETLPFEARTGRDEVVGERTLALLALVDGEADVVVTTARGLSERILPPDDFRSATIRLAPGDRADLSDLLHRLVDLGYEPAAVVNAPGTFSHRGGILDVFPVQATRGLRAEIGADELESLRWFDPATQRSVEPAASLVAPPAREVLLDAAHWKEADDRARALGGETYADFEERFHAGHYFPGVESYRTLLHGELSLLTDYLPDGAFVLFEDPRSLRGWADRIVEEARAFRKERGDRDPLLPGADELFVGWERMVDAARASVWIAPGGEEALADEMRARGLSPAVRAAEDSGPERFGADLKRFTVRLVELTSQGYRVALAAETPTQAGRLREVLAERLEALREEEGAPTSHVLHAVDIVTAPLSQGFRAPRLKLAIFTEHEVLRHHRMPKRRPRASFEAAAAGADGGSLSVIEDYQALTRGDFVVHAEHGIGRFQGIEKVTVDGNETDCLALSYRGGDRLLVPVLQLPLVRKYLGKDGTAPSLHRIGGTQWEKSKSRTKKAVKILAEDLLALEAARAAYEGFPAPPDGTWQRELEAAFPYRETVDQLRAVESVKLDMEDRKPMDRLVVGDVGYGKTEVAIRAAFKAIQAGKQVAVLVPTTILAQQHGVTLAERFAAYPVRVEVLSRFKTPKEQKAIVAETAAGRVDVLVGTHRLLSKDVKFKDLGLVVVDEEHRFGVGHKERLKTLRKLVDVLTLTATPIPRTLHMALAGARQMSVINTPPGDRIPVHTEVAEFSEELIRRAIARELERDGQVFFVHNRVRSIASMAAYVQRIVPDARIAVGHGQMTERALEKVMLDFMDRKVDVLVSTMIIESGLDLPNANTILVNRADMLGLAQLHQIRGRVGRSHHRAYCYYLLPRNRVLGETADKRMAAVAAMTDLGSGFKIAMKDMEIRGAGNLLGAEQSGFIADVGFDLYCRLLQEAISEGRGEEVVEEVETKLRWSLDAYFPDEWVGDRDQKLVLYRRLSESESEEDIRRLREEVEDRFGPLPPPAENLFLVQAVKAAASPAGVEEVRESAGTVRLTFAAHRRPGNEALEALVSRLTHPFEFVATGRFEVVLRTPGGPEALREAAAALTALAIGGGPANNG